MPWKETTKMDQKKEFIILYKSGSYPISHLAEMFSISRPTAYKYIKRYEQHGIQGLLELPTRPHNIPNKTSSEIEDQIISLRTKHPRWGAAKLLVLLEDKLPNKKLPKLTTVNNILKKNGLIKARKRRIKIEPIYPKFDPSAPNEIWSADFKGKFRLGNQSYIYPLTIADSCSRFVFAAKGLKQGTFRNTKIVFTNIFREYGLPEQIHTDNGPPFGSIRSLGRLSRLSVWFMELGIKPVFSDPAHPEQNGRHERMHRELKGEATRPPGYNIQLQQRKLNSFVREYNEIRPHAALNMKTPASVHTYSQIKYPDKISEWIYPKEIYVRYVTTTGGIKIGKNNMLYLSTVLGGKDVGLEELGNKIYRVYFREFFLGYADLREFKMYDIMTYKNELRV